MVRMLLETDREGNQERGELESRTGFGPELMRCGSGHKGMVMIGIILGTAWLLIVLGCFVLTDVELGRREDDEHSS